MQLAVKKSAMQHGSIKSEQPRNPVTFRFMRAIIPRMSTTDLQPDHREGLWKSLLTAEMNVCYWGWVSDSCVKWDTRIKILIALTASGTVASWGFWTQHPAVWKLLSGVSAIAAIIHPYVYSSERLKRIASLVGRWKEVCTNYQVLWEKDQRLASEASWSQFEETKVREGNMDETNLPKKPKLIEKAFQHVLCKRGLQDGTRQRTTETAATPATAAAQTGTTS
jgi:hypothetical protein